MVLDVEAQGGKAGSAKHSLPRMCHLIERLAPEERPALVRGDNAFGNERVMSEMDIDSPQQVLGFVDSSDQVKIWEYAVLVTNTDYSLEAMGQLYRNRADCENGFDELKNQWGWGGYTTHDLERCNLSARAVALIYNWWSWYVRLVHPKTRMEARTGTPLPHHRVSLLHPGTDAETGAVAPAAPVYRATEACAP